MKYGYYCCMKYGGDTILWGLLCIWWDSSPIALAVCNHNHAVTQVQFFHQWVILSKPKKSENEQPLDVRSIFTWFQLAIHIWETIFIGKHLHNSSFPSVNRISNQFYCDPLLDASCRIRYCGSKYFQFVRHIRNWCVHILLISCFLFFMFWSKIHWS